MSHVPYKMIRWEWEFQKSEIKQNIVTIESNDHSQMEKGTSLVFKFGKISIFAYFFPYLESPYFKVLPHVG